MSGRKKIVMTKAVRERLPEDIAFGNGLEDTEMICRHIGTGIAEIF